MTEPLPGHDPGDAATPWVCTADALVGGAVLFLTVALVVAGWRNLAEEENRRLRAEVIELRRLLAAAECARDCATAESERLGAELVATKAQFEERTRERDAAYVHADIAVALLGVVVAERDALRDLVARSYLAGEVNRDLEKRLADALTGWEKTKTELARTQTDLKEARADLDKATKRVDELGKRLDAAALALKAAEEKNKALAGDLKDALAEQKRLKDELDTARLALKNANIKLSAFQPTVHQELLGLRGNLKKTAIVLDTSGSMVKKVKLGDGREQSRWDFSRGVVKTWVEHLGMGECVLVTFGSTATTYPADGTAIPLGGEAGPAGRARLAGILDRLPAPDGATNTKAAIEAAYRVEGLTAVILFSDGKPETTGKTNEAFRQEIYQLIDDRQKERRVPINTVGIGDYFEPELAGFLMTVADKTGGVFLGR